MHAVSACEYRRRFGVTCVVYGLWAVGYEVVGSVAGRLPAVDLSLPIDALIPFAPQWVFVYQLAYLLPFAAILAIRDPERFDRAVLAISAAAVAAWPVYLALPVSFAQPGPGPGLAGQLLALERALESGSTNHLPSLHVANAWVLYFAVRRQRLGRAGDRVALLLAFAISASTLMVKQHIALDVACGALLGLVAWHLAGLLLNRARSGVRGPSCFARSQVPSPSPMPHGTFARGWVSERGSGRGRSGAQ